MNDIIVGLQHGDEGKGKVVYHMIKNGNYDCCVRFNGGPNAGHTIYVGDRKIVTHQLPSGILHGIPSLINIGCVVDTDKLQLEIDQVMELGIDVASLLKISRNVHVIKQSHIDEDTASDKIGSTKRGIRPVYRDKINRRGVRIVDDKDSVDFLQRNGIELVDSYEFLKNKKVLFEGAQGFELDIDWGDYPYVTSSNCIAGYAVCSGVSPKSIGNIWGVAKLYDTYVGAKQFQSDNEVFKTLARIGNEYGSTTGRNRQCNWLNIDTLKRSIGVNGITHLVINKCDIIKQLDVFAIIKNGSVQYFDNYNDMAVYIMNEIDNFNLEEIHFSGHKDRI